MGQTVSAVRDEAKKESDQKEKEANDALNSLQDLAKLQIRLFLQTVKDDKDTTKIAVGKIISQSTTINCSVSTDGQKIAEDIKKSYKAFASGDIADGISSVLSTGLDALFGNASANSNEEDRYFITVGALGYPLRVDMHLYTYAFKSTTLISVAKNVLAVAIVVSSVDLTTLDESSMGSIVQYCYGGVDEAKQQAILDKLLAVKAKIHPSHP